MAESVSSISQFLTDGGTGPSLYLLYEERQLESSSCYALISSLLGSINNPTMARLQFSDQTTVPLDNDDVP